MRFFSKIQCLLVLLVLSVNLVHADDGSGAEAIERPLPIKELASGTYNNQVLEKRYILARDESRLAQIERLIGQNLKVNLDRYMVVAAFMGQRSSSGYDIEIASAIKGRDKVRLQALLTSPGSGCLVLPALSSPYQVVAIPAAKGPVALQEEQETTLCP